MNSPAKAYGHPKGLYVLFFTEMWERFSFYGMRAILVLYMVAHVTEINPGLGWDKADALSVYGWYSASVYILGLIGGYLADRFIGQKRSVLIGGSILVVGHSILAIPSLFFFYSGLVLISMGVGFLKPNISSMVGQLYPEKDPRRDSGFTIFYVGINTGALISSLIVGYVGEVYGWHYGFGLSGVGMLAGLLVYIWGQPYLANVGNLIEPTKVIEKASKAPLTAAELKRCYLLLIACVVNVVFISAFEQAGGLTSIYTDEKINRVVLGFEIPASVFQALNPFFVITCGTLVASVWLILRNKRAYCDTIFKISTGLVLSALALFCLSAAALESAAAADQKASLIWLVLSYLLMTLGELSIMPVGLSYVTKLAPKQYASLAMGLYFFCMGVGNKVAGFMGGMEGEFETFTTIGVFCLATAIFLYIFRPAIVKLAPGVEG